MNKIKNKQYFEGWFYKIVSCDLNNIYAFIPGISKTGDKNEHCFIQVMDGTNFTSYNIRYPIESFSYVTDNTIRIENNIFSKNGIRLDIDDAELKITGEILFDNLSDIKRNIISPSAMGFFEYFSFLECKHEVLSMNHTTKGELVVNHNLLDFNNGKGYIEKDMGVSFPKDYVWIQSNHFDNPNTSLMCSVANIPFINKSFNGFICILQIDGKEYRFTTYNNSKIKYKNVNQNCVSLMFKNHKNYLIITAETERTAPLYSPKNAAMSSRIMESLKSNISFSLYDKNKNLLRCDKSSVAGLEIVI